MEPKEDMQRTLRGIELILANLDDDRNIDKLTHEQVVWYLKVTRQQLDNIVFNMRQQYPKD